MTKAELKKKIMHLSPEEQRELAAELWEHGVKPLSLEVPEWHERVIEARLKSHIKNPKNVIPGKEIFV